LCQRVLGSLDVSTALFQLGRSKVFFKGGVIARLEELLANVLVDSTVLLQGCVRRRRTTPISHTRCSARTLQAHMRGALARTDHVKALTAERAAVRMQRCVRGALKARQLAMNRTAAANLQAAIRGQHERARACEPDAPAQPPSPVAAAEAEHSATPAPMTTRNNTNDAMSSGVFSDCCETGVQTDGAGAGGGHRGAGGGGPCEMRLPDGRVMTAEDVLALLREKVSLRALQHAYIYIHVCMFIYIYVCIYMYKYMYVCMYI